MKNLDGLSNNVLQLFGRTNSYELTVAERSKCTAQAQQHARYDVVLTIQISEMLLHMQLHMHVLISVQRGKCLTDVLQMRKWTKFKSSRSKQECEIVRVINQCC